MHWRTQRAVTSVDAGYGRDCPGIDAELVGLRRLHASDGRVMNLLRRYGMTETGT